MTFAYGAGNASWSKHIKEEYSAICPGAEIPRGGYLAKKIRKAATELLPGPTAVMQCIGKLASGLAGRNEILKWESPTGFPVANDYRFPENADNCD